MIIELLYDEAGNINDHRFIKANDVFEKHTGLKNDKLIGKTAKQTFLKIDPLWLANYDEVNKTGKPKCFINFNKSTGCWYDVFCIPYGDNMIGVFFKDITEKVQAREALHKNEEKYKDFMMACFDSIYRASPDWKQINILKEEGTLADIPVLDSNSMKMYIHPDDRAYVANEINRAFLNKNIFDSEHRIFKEDGNIIWIRSRAVPIINEDGEVTEWFGAVNDITLEKEFELKLLENEKEYLEIIDSSSLGSFIIDFEKKNVIFLRHGKKD
ncbi:MAG TPA: PAS domain-containing protein [Thermoanaerobacterales bacterium]|nr:PAS domain-containing protein [Thermoanaerobacterales bacterium]